MTGQPESAPLRFTLSIDVDGASIASHADLFAAIHGAASTMLNTFGAVTSPVADEVGIVFDVSGHQVGLWGVGGRTDDIVSLRARAVAAEDRLLRRERHGT